MGHGQLRKHLQQICPHEGDTSCRKCGMSDETSSHITQDCEDLAHRTLQFFGNYRLENCHGQNRLISSLMGLITDTDMFECLMINWVSTIDK
jgi:hypothetical protein